MYVDKILTFSLVKLNVYILQLSQKSNEKKLELFSFKNTYLINHE